MQHCPDRPTPFSPKLPKPPEASRSRGLPRGIGFALGAIALSSFTSPAMAAREPQTRLVRCGAENCLQISGYRDDPGMTISLNGNAVSAEGKRDWRVRLPLDLARQWSAPHARTIEITVRDPKTAEEVSAVADLPIGLLGNVTLDTLEITAP